MITGSTALAMERDALKAEISRLTAALKRECDLTVTLREAISWIEDQDPQIVEAARQKFNVEQSVTEKP